MVFECAIEGCPHLSETKSGLKRHKRRHLPQTITCELCNATFYFRVDWESHIKQFSEIPQCFCFPCEDCLKVFSTEPDYILHRRNHHSEPALEIDNIAVLPLEPSVDETLLIQEFMNTLADELE